MENLSLNKPTKHFFPGELVPDNIRLDLDSFKCADYIIDKILTKGSKIIYSHYLNTKLPNNLSTYFYNACCELVQHEIRTYDPGENIDSLLFNWEEDEEPVILFNYFHSHN